MIISELIDRLTQVKKDHGDCKVFVLTKSILEGAVIADAKDTAIVALGSSEGDPEVIFAISACSIIPDRKATAEDLEKILKGKATSSDKDKEKEEKISSALNRPETCLFIGIEDVVFSLFAETDRSYIDYDEIRRFNYFVQDCRYELNYDHITIDLGLDTFERFAQYRVDLFHRVDERLYRNCLTSRCISGIRDPEVRELVVKFLKDGE